VGLCSGMIVSACLALLFQPVGMLASCFGEAAGAMASLLALAVACLARAPGSSLSAAALPAAWTLLLLFLVCAFPFAARTGRGAAILLLGTAAFCGRWAGNEAMHALRAPASVAFLDVGQGDGAVCRLPGAAILVDAGPPEAGRKVILPYLRSQGVGKLDLVVVTHPDLDHYGGLAYLAEHIGIGAVVHPGDEADSRAWKGLRETLERRGIPMVRVRSGQRLYAGPEMAMTVLSPEFPGQYPERNDNSVVAMLELHGRRVLFTGDIGSAPERHLLAAGGTALASAVLKVPHHGSDRTNVAPFFAAVRPEVAVLSAGRKNRFRHPGPATMEELEGLGARILLTARHGALTFGRCRFSETWKTHLDPPDEDVREPDEDVRERN
jgi:beta-lactamase superfamily II metal-dependent hydrolase